MIKLTGLNGETHWLTRDVIAQVTEAGASSRWHGIRAIVRTFDGRVIEAQQDAAAIVRLIDAENAAGGEQA